ncbi:MAG: transcription termination/antitermination protein NusA [Ruminococcus sp.]|nr:transcription termination/antitermination protein NusA [Ruminococcus sp.]
MASNKELFLALQLLEKEKGIPVEYMISQISKAIVSACRNLYGGNENVEIKMDPEKNAFSVKLMKMVVEEVEDENFEISLEDARVISKRATLDKEIGIPLEPKKFGRIAVQTARSVIRQGIRDGEKGQMLVEFQSKQQEIATALVERVDPNSGNATIRFGKAEAVLPKSEQIPGEELKEGSSVKIYVAGVKDGDRGPRAIISRTHPDFVRRLFENEVPEIFDGIVEIKSVSREAGSRTKMAVFSEDSEVDAVGACIGTRGARVSAIVDELCGEKIDIVLYSEDPAKYVAAALSPASVVGVEIIDLENKSCKATVPDSQLSLAIGNKGQNVRLAAKLTGWKIDIRPESGFWGEETESDTEEVSAEAEE